MKWTIRKFDEIGFTLEASRDGYPCRVVCMIVGAGPGISISVGFNEALAEATVSILNGEQNPSNAKEMPLPPTVWRKSDGAAFDYQTSGLYKRRDSDLHATVSTVINSGEFSTSPEGLPNKVETKDNKGFGGDWIQQLARHIAVSCGSNHQAFIEQSIIDFYNSRDKAPTEWDKPEKKDWAALAENEFAKMEYVGQRGTLAAIIRKHAPKETKKSFREKLIDWMNSDDGMDI